MTALTEQASASAKVVPVACIVMDNVLLYCVPNSGLADLSLQEEETRVPKTSVKVARCGR